MTTRNDTVAVRTKCLMYLFRYALGRETYCVGDVADALIEHRDQLTDDWRHQIIEDVRVAVVNNRAGTETDIRRWEEVARVMA